METPTKKGNETGKKQRTGGMGLGLTAIHLIVTLFIESLFGPFSDNKNEETPTEQEYNMLKAQIESYTKRKIINVIFPALLIGVLAFYVFTTYGSEATRPLVIRVMLSIFSVSIFLWHRELYMNEKQQRIRRYELSHAQDEAEVDPFQNSIKTSYKYLDRYYDQTQRQAQQGFHITVFIAVCGALLIFGGVAAMYFGFIQPAYITCASGAITELIAAVFFYLYNKTVTSMSRYHNKLVLSQNISFALRVADSLEENKDAAKLEIIKELMKDVNAQMMKSDTDADEPPKKDKPSPSDTLTQ